MDGWGGWTALKVLVTCLLLADMAHSVATVQTLGYAQMTMHVVAGVASILISWVPRVGAVAGAVFLSLAMFIPPAGADLAVLVIATLVYLPRVSSMGMLVLSGSLVTYSVVVSLLHSGDGWFNDAGLRATLVVIATLAGLAVRGFSTQLSRGAKRIEQLEHERVQIRVAERQRLARELHDIVAHQLAIISLQSISHRHAEDPEELGMAMDRIGTAARTAVTELHTLVNVLDVDPDSGVDPQSATIDASVVLPELAETLRAEGFSVDLSVPEALAGAPRSAQVTLSRVAREATTNILRHADPRGPVTMAVTMENDRIAMVLSNRMRDGSSPGPLAEHSLGRGLRGLAERVDLASGVLEVGPQQGQWVVKVCLPDQS
ncbi:sensor histidine kinase [Aestuariimicrobium sp. Y1814]|uniref:sensor histidine kinase n=1 Tax=Aestuariimicrobium sp. Y1814 TaxID=3418742 RepID=UPI003DA72827